LTHLFANYKRLLAVTLAEGKHCQCRDEDSCPHTGGEWCHRLSTKGNNPIPELLPQPDALRCLYSDRPACCWVLAEVETLANEHLAEAGISNPPVPSELINIFDKSSKIEVRLVPSLKTLHGAVWHLDREWIMQLNARDHRRHRRYTMFHEAFHIAYRIINPAFKETELSHISFNEVLADHFATCLLMRKEWIEECWPRVQGLGGMADIFDVPIRQMRKRLSQLGLLQKASDCDVVSRTDCQR